MYIVEFMDQYEYQSQRLRRDLFWLVVDDSLLEITVLTVNGRRLSKFQSHPVEMKDLSFYLSLVKLELGI